MHEPILHKIGEREFKCSPLTQEIKDQWRTYVESQELANIRSMTDSLFPHEVNSLIKDHLFQVKHKKYAFDSSISWQYLQQQEHLKHFFLYCLNKYNVLTEEYLDSMLTEHPQDFADLFSLIIAQKKT